MYSLGRQNSIIYLRKLLNTPNAYHLQIPAQSGKQIHTFGLYLKQYFHLLNSPFTDSTVAILYPEPKLKTILHVLENMKCEGEGMELDLQMADILMSRGYVTALMEGSYFQHLGFQSSLSEKFNEERSTKRKFAVCQLWPKNNWLKFVQALF